VGLVTSHQPSAPREEGKCFFSYNSADGAVEQLIRDAVLRLRRIQLTPWVYTEDARLGTRKYDSMHESMDQASSVAYFVGPEGLGRIQRVHETDWAMDKETDSAHIFIVLLPDVSPDTIPPKLGNPSQVPLQRDDVDEGHLTVSGFAKLCGGILNITKEEGSNWLHRRERELFLSPPRRARALLVGVCEYDDEDLANLREPSSDVEELESVLKSLQLQGGIEWEVRTQADLRREDLIRALNAFFINESDPDDLQLFYFSGHGAANESGAYVLPRDGSGSRPAASGGVGADTLKDFLHDTSAWASIVILDCCHGDAAGPDAGTYNSLPERCAVLGASVGPTDASGKDGLSPFTSALISILREEEPLTMAELDARLKAYHSTAWAQLGTLGSIEKVKLGTIRNPRAVDVPRLTHKVVVGESDSEGGRGVLLRRLIRTLDALLAATPQRSSEMDAVIRDSLEVVIEEMQKLTRGSGQDVPTWAELNEMDPQPLVEVLFAAPDMKSFAGLPWEYLGVPAGGSLDWLLRSRICRVVPVAATKSASAGKILSPLVLSAAPPSEWGLGLQEFTKLETEYLKTGSFVDSSHWGKLVKSKPDLLAIQCALSPPHDMRMDTPWSIPYLKAAVDEKPIRVVVIETVADGRNPCAGVIHRELAYALAQATSRSVIAICHQAGYTSKLNDLVKLGRSAETTGPYYSFVATLTKELMAGAKLEEAAYTARQRAVMALGPEAGPLVGIPVTVRAEPKPGAKVSPRPALDPRRQQGPTGESAAQEPQSEFA
jgi:hypothetical protein